MECVIVDTSSIIFGISNSIDVFEKISEMLPGCVMLISNGVQRELKGIGLGKGRNSKYARISLELIGKKKLTVRRDDGNVDAWILKETASGKCAVCTNDTKLRRSLRQNGAKVLTLGMDGRLR